MSYIIDRSIPASPLTYTKGRAGFRIEKIVIHYTGGKGNARENCLYFSGGNRQASAHFFIDGGPRIYESVSPRDTAWAVGNKRMNRRTVSIEVCSNGEDFTEDEIKQTAWLVQKLMQDYGLLARDVIRHHDAYDYGNPNEPWASPHKACPAPYMNEKKWRKLHARLTGESIDNGGNDDYSQIAVDGWIGKGSVSAWQKILNMQYVDGIISGQYRGSKSHHAAFASMQYGSGGSNLVRAVQKMVGVAQDGYMGPDTIRAWQKYIGITADGWFGHSTARATQRWINAKLKENKIIL